MAAPDIGWRRAERRAIVIGILTGAMALLVGWITAGAWGAAARGRVAAVTTLGQLVVVISRLGLDDVVLAQRKLSQSLHTVVLATIPLTAVIASLAWWLLLYDSLGPASAGFLIVYSIGASSAGLAIVLLLQRDRIPFVELYRIITIGITFSVVALWATLDLPGNEVTAWTIGSALLTVTAIPVLGLKRFSLGAARIPALAVSSFLGQVAIQALNRADVLIVAAILGLESGGIYAIAISLSDVGQLVSRSVAPLILRQSARGDAVSNYLPYVLIATLLSLTAALIGIVVVPILLGDGFVQVGPIALVLAMGQAPITAHRFIWAKAMVAGGRTTIAACTAIALACMIIADTYLLPRYGLVAAAAISSTAYALAYLSSASLTRFSVA